MGCAFAGVSLQQTAQERRSTETAADKHKAERTSKEPCKNTFDMLLASLYITQTPGEYLFIGKDCKSQDMLCNRAQAQECTSHAIISLQTHKKTLLTLDSAAPSKCIDSSNQRVHMDRTGTDKQNFTSPHHTILLFAFIRRHAQASPKLLPLNLASMPTEAPYSKKFPLNQYHAELPQSTSHKGGLGDAPRAGSPIS
jgi:hypothetical protein